VFARERNLSKAERRRRRLAPELVPTNDTPGAGFRLMGGMVLQRLPKFLPDPSLLEQDFLVWQDQRLKETRMQISDDIWRQLVYEEPKKIPLLPRVTEADVANDRHSLDRKIFDSLYLILKKRRKDYAWGFPAGPQIDRDRSMKGTARRELKELVSRECKFHILSNSPLGHLRYKYPEGFKEYPYIGAKIFYYHALHMGGTVSVDPEEIEDYAWVTRDELKEYLPKNLFDLCNRMLCSTSDFPFRGLPPIEPVGSLAPIQQQQSQQVNTQQAQQKQQKQKPAQQSQPQV